MDKRKAFEQKQAERCASGSTTCPLRQVETGPQWITTALASAQAARHGLPFMRQAGGVDAQPAKWWKAVQIAFAEHTIIDQEGSKK